jgi:hypothetical protein
LENKILKDGLGVQFEYTGPGSPQFNGRVERKFATLFSRVRTMLNGARLPKELREGVWAEAAKLSTDIENILVTPIKSKPAHNVFFKVDEPKPILMKPFGDIAVIENNKSRKLRSKLEDRGYPAMYLGMAENHSDQVYHFLKLDTNQVILSRDVLWLDKSYGDWKGVKPSESIYIPGDDADEEYSDTYVQPSTGQQYDDIKYYLRSYKQAH